MWRYRGYRSYGYVNWGAIIFFLLILMIIASGGRFPWVFFIFPWWFMGAAWWRGHDRRDQRQNMFDIEKHKRQWDSPFVDNDLTEKPKRDAQMPEFITTPDGESFEVADPPQDEARGERYL